MIQGVFTGLRYLEEYQVLECRCVALWSTKTRCYARYVAR